MFMVSQMEVLSIPKFFELFDASIHQEMLSRADKFKATHFVCYEVINMSSSLLGQRTSLVVGGLSSTTFEQSVSIKLGDVPSSFQSPRYYTVLAGDLQAEAEKALNWGKSNVNPESERGNIGRETDKSLCPSDEDIQKLKVLASSYEDNRSDLFEIRFCSLYMDGKVYAALRISIRSKTYPEVSYTVVGGLPKHKRKKVVYKIEGEKREWYLAGYYDSDEPNMFNPVGRTFSLHPWDVSGRLDDGEKLRPIIHILVRYH